jgi:hypothetical protein
VNVYDTNWENWFSFVFIGLLKTYTNIAFNFVKRRKEVLGKKRLAQSTLQMCIGLHIF